MGKILEENYESTRAQLVSTNSFLNRQMANPKSGSEIALEIAGLEKEIQTLKQEVDDKEEELRVMWESKKYHKRISHETQMKLNHVIIDLTSERAMNKKEREKDSKTIEDMMNDNGKYATD